VKTRGIVIHGASDRGKLEAAKRMRRAATPAEETLWQNLRRGQLDGLHFRRQQVIDGFVVDFYCGSVDLIIEVDGSVHESVANREYDAERTRVLSARGLRVLRVTNDDVLSDVGAVLSRIRSFVARAS
jgi:very-short-patch-repair endonuclease